MQIQAQTNRFNNSINFKDAPPFIQMAMAAKDGLVDPSFATKFIEDSLRQLYPQVSQLVDKEQFEQQQQAAQNQAAQNAPQGANNVMPMQPQAQQQKNAQTMTQAAMNSLRSGQMPAM